MTPSAFVEALANLGVMGVTFGVVPVPILFTILGVSSLASGTYAIAQSDTGQALTNEGELSLSDKELKLMELLRKAGANFFISKELLSRPAIWRPAIWWPVPSCVRWIAPGAACT